MDRKNIITPNQTIHILLAMKKKFIKFNTSVYGNMPQYIKLNLVQSLLETRFENNIFAILLWFEKYVADNKRGGFASWSPPPLPL